MKNIIVFGALGLLGRRLCPFLSENGFNVIKQSRGTEGDLRIDPTDQIAIDEVLNQYRPIALINLIAATNVDQCEVDLQVAWVANVSVVSALSQSIKVHRTKTGQNIHLIHLSTDQVYSGSGPHAEDKVSPVNVYGLSKYTGELLAHSVGATVLRTNFFGRSLHNDRKSFSDWLVNSLTTRAQITLFDDIKFSALHINSLSEVILRCIEIAPEGVFNLGCRNGVSKAEFGLLLARKLGFITNNIQISSSIYFNLKAPRPLDMTLDVSKIENRLGMICPNIVEEIELTAQEYLNA